MFPNTIINILAGAASSALSSVAASPNNGFSPSDVLAVSEQVKREIIVDPRIQEIGKAVDEATTPVVWYNDKITLASIVSVIASVIGIVWGVQLTPEHQALIVNVAPPILTAVAGGVALVSRLVSRVKPVVSRKAKTA